MSRLTRGHGICAAVAFNPARAIAVALLAIVFTAAGQTEQGPARRVISLVPALTEMLFAIGAGPSVVAVSSFDAFPPEVGSLPKVGALLDPDTERILAMRPDLVLIYGSQTDLKGQLSRAGIETFDYRHGGVQHVITTIRQLGAATGHSSEAARVAQEIERGLAEVRAQVSQRPPVRTLLVFGREPLSLRNLYASGGVGFLHELVEASGGTNVFGEIDRESVQVSTEMLLTRKPEIIVELRVGQAPDADRMRRELEPWQLLQGVPAVKTGRVHILYGDHLVVPGPRIVQAARGIALALHRDAFK